MSKKSVIAALSVTVLTVFIALYYHVTLREATLLPTSERSNDTKSTAVLVGVIHRVVVSQNPPQ